MYPYSQNSVTVMVFGAAYEELKFEVIAATLTPFSFSCNQLLTHTE